MKSMNAFSTDLFLNPTASLTGTWYEPSRPATRKRAAALRRELLEQQGHKQETVCSVILVFCMLFSIAVCFAQFAVS